MDTIANNSANSGYSCASPILLAATSDAAMDRAERTVLASGFRIGARLPIDQAEQRILLQPRTSALWLEVDEDCGGPMDSLLDMVSRDVRDGRYAAVVSTNSEMLDPLAARLDDPAVEIIVNASDAERAAALAIAIEGHRAPARYADIASDQNAERLRQLSEEVSRIASTLARLSSGPVGASPALREVEGDGEVPPLQAETVRGVIRARRLRARYFAEDMFADPAWDMLLDLLQAEVAQLRVPVSSLCIAAAVPATTALRWLKTMVAQGLFQRRADPHDGRRVFVELAPEASIALRRYFAQAGRAVVI